MHFALILHTWGGSEMALLQVRDFPDDLYKEYAAYARNENRSIAQQTIYLIRKELGATETNKSRRRRLLDNAAANPLTLSSEAKDPADIVNEDRNV